VVGVVEAGGLHDVVGTLGSVEVVVPGPPVVPVDEPVVGPVVEVVEVLPVVVVATLVELVGATGTVPGGTSGWEVLVVLGSPEVVGTVVVEGSVVTDEELVTPVVVVDGVVVVDVGGRDVTDVTDVTGVTDGSDVALPVGELVVVVGSALAAADRAGIPKAPVATSRAKIVARDPAARRGSPLIEIGEEKGISGAPTFVRSADRPSPPANGIIALGPEPSSSDTGTLPDPY
jgi:hypothetical protein